MNKNTILNSTEIEHKTKRIAYQIFENNSNEIEIVLAGIEGNGYVFAERLLKVLESISSLQVTLCKVSIDKTNPLNTIYTDLPKNEYTNKSIVLVDDVLNSGKTLIYGIKHFLDVPLKRFKTAVLVNRNHKKYPVKADFKGISLATTVQEHVEVVFSKDGDTAYLT